MLYNELIELSHEIIDFSYPGDPKFELNSKKIDNYTISEIKIGSHASTHVDYPMHVGLTNKNFKNIIGKGFCVTIDNLEEFLDFKKNYIPEYEILLINTKFSDFWENPAYFEMEIDIEKFVEKLVQMDLKAVGVDCASIGNFKVHEKLLSSNILIIENLKNLKKLENKSFEFLGFPLNIKKIDGSPINAVALF